MDFLTGDRDAARGFPHRDRSTTSWIAAALLAALTVAVAVTFRHYGATFDEAVQDDYGRYILDWYLTLGADRNAVTYLDLFYYGGLFDTLAALANKISPFGHYETRHLLNGLAGIAGLAGCWRLGCRLGGPAAGLMSLAALALMPSWYGMMFINPKDIPFAAAMVWGVALLTDIAENPEHPRRRTVVVLGLAVGLALGVRIGAVLLLGYLGCVLAVAAAQRLGDGWRPAIAFAVRATRSIVLPVLIIAWAVMLVFWPYAQIDPIANPIDAYLHFAHRSADIATLYFGSYVGGGYQPPLYLPVYLLLKLPDVVLAVLAGSILLGCWRLVRRQWPRQPLRFLPLLLSLTVPSAYVLATDPPLYDAERHFLFLLPLLAVVVGLGLAEVFAQLSRPLARGALAAAIAVGCAVQVAEMVRLHPYEYAFFNDLVGGVAGAAGRFETEYWGEALTEAADALAARLAQDNAADPVAVYLCGEPHSIAERLPLSVRLVEEWEDARYYLSTTRNHCDDEVPGREVLRVEREGVPFAVVKEVAPALARVPAQAPHS
jgi:hypothetical protein